VEAALSDKDILNMTSDKHWQLLRLPYFGCSAIGECSDGRLGAPAYTTAAANYLGQGIPEELIDVKEGPLPVMAKERARPSGRSSGQPLIKRVQVPANPTDTVILSRRNRVVFRTGRRPFIGYDVMYSKGQLRPKFRLVPYKATRPQE
jgi:hypothetical protein